MKHTNENARENLFPECTCAAYWLSGDQVRAAFSRARSGRGSVVTVCGVQGTGKTRFLQELVSGFQASNVNPTVIRSVRGSSTGSGYGVLANVMEWIRSVKPDFSNACLDRMYHVYDDDAPLALADRKHADSMAHHCALQVNDFFTRNKAFASNCPAVFILENCHFEEYLFWRFWERYSVLQDNPASLPCLWMIETNKTDAPSAVLRPESRITRVELTPFDIGSAEKTILSIPGLTQHSGRFVPWILNLSDGLLENMNLILKVCWGSGALAFSGCRWKTDPAVLKNLLQKDTLDQLLEWYIGTGLSVEQKTVLGHLALWPDGCSLQQISLTREPNERDTGTLEQLVQSGWIAEQPVDSVTKYVFTHMIWKEKVYETIPAYVRNEYHLQIADALRKEDNRNPADISGHYFSGNNRLHGCDFALKAGIQYRDRGDFETAVACFRRIIEHMPDRNRTKIAQVSYELAHALVAANQFSEAVQALVTAEPILESRFYQKRDKARYMLLLGLSFINLEEYSSAENHLKEALDFLPKTTAFDLRLKIMACFAQLSSRTGSTTALMELFNTYQKRLPIQDHPYFSGILLSVVAGDCFSQNLSLSAEYYLKESILCAENLNDVSALIDRHIFLGTVYEKMSCFHQAAEAYGHVISISRRHAVMMGLCRGLCHAASLTVSRNDRLNLEPMLVEATGLANTLGDPELIIRSTVLYSDLLIDNGRIDTAERLLLDLQPLVHTCRTYPFAGSVYIHLASIAERRGNFPLMMDFYDRLLYLMSDSDQMVNLVFAHLYKARACCIMQMFRQAEEHIASADTLLEKNDLQIPDCDILRAHVLLRQNDPVQAKVPAQRGLANAKRDAFLHQQAEAWNILGMIERDLDNVDAAISCFKTAIDLYYTNNNTFEAAKTHRLLACVYDSAGRSGIAKQELLAADRLFRQLSTPFYLSESSACKSPEHDCSASDHLQFTPADVTGLLQSLTHPEQITDTVLKMMIRHGNCSRGAVFRISRSSGDVVVAENIGFTDRELDAVISANIRADGSVLEQPCVLLLDSDAGDDYVMVCEDTEPPGSASCSRLPFLAPVVTAAFRLAQDIRKLRTQFRNVHVNTDVEAILERIVARSPAMVRVVDAVKTAAWIRIPLLITGSSGTGKSLLTDVIHKLGFYRSVPPIVVPCKTLAAASQSDVLFKILSPAVQIAETREPVGRLIVLRDIEMLKSAQQEELVAFLNPDSTESHGLYGCRFVCVTACNLQKHVTNRVFSETLFRILSNLTIHLPELVERREDIPSLAHFFLEQFSAAMKKAFSGFSSRAMEGLLHYPWPGNVTELQDAVETAVLFGTPPNVTIHDLPRAVRMHVERFGLLDTNKPALQSIEDMEEAHIRAILDGTGGNKYRACEMLGISRPTLDRKLAKFGIRVQKKRKR